MSNNALTEKRRETVIGLLKNMNIKKGRDGGFDKDDVYDCMQQLCDLYEQNIEELQNTYETEIVVLKERYAKYDENNELYVSLIMEAKKSSNDIINQAKTEVEEILAEGRAQIAKQEEEMKILYEEAENEKVAINEDLNATRRAVEAEKIAMKAELDAEREKCNALKFKYTQQLLSIEDEFMDIKTNILRTAGKIDSVKAKFEDESTFTWEVSEIQDTVAFPEPEVEVEDVRPVEDTLDVEIEIEEPIAIEEFDLDNIEVEVPEIEEGVEIEETPVEEVIESLQVEDIFGEAETEEISFDDIDFSSLDEVSEDDEEISFEGLESLFKED